MSTGTSGEWPVRPNPITPQGIRSATFHASPIAWRGYSPQDVRQLLDAAADALQEAQEESVGLAAEVDRLRNFYRTHSADTIAAGPQLGRDGYGLMAAVRGYAPTQVQQACDYADRVAEREQDTDQALKHARIRTSIVVDEAIHGAHGTPPGRNVEQAQLWIRYFAHALRSYTSTVYDTIAGALTRGPGGEQRRSHDPRGR